eukprot:30941-Pelagococcus_subviridis.AAC.2
MIPIVSNVVERPQRARGRPLDAPLARRPDARRGGGIAKRVHVAFARLTRGVGVGVGVGVGSAARRRLRGGRIGERRVEVDEAGRRGGGDGVAQPRGFVFPLVRVRGAAARQRDDGDGVAARRQHRERVHDAVGEVHRKRRRRRRRRRDGAPLPVHERPRRAAAAAAAAARFDPPRRLRARRLRARLGVAAALREQRPANHARHPPRVARRERAERERVAVKQDDALHSAAGAGVGAGRRYRVRATLRAPGPAIAAHAPSRPSTAHAKSAETAVARRDGAAASSAAPALSARPTARRPPTKPPPVRGDDPASDGVRLAPRSATIAASESAVARSPRVWS